MASLMLIVFVRISSFLLYSLFGQKSLSTDLHYISRRCVWCVCSLYSNRLLSYHNNCVAYRVSFLYIFFNLELPSLCDDEIIESPCLYAHDTVRSSADEQSFDFFTSESCAGVTKNFRRHQGSSLNTSPMWWQINFTHGGFPQQPRCGSFFILVILVFLLLLLRFFRQLV